MIFGCVAKAHGEIDGMKSLSFDWHFKYVGDE